MINSGMSKEEYQQALLSIIEEMKARIRTGPAAQYKEETSDQYLRRRQSFERCCRGMIKMAEHQLGLREVQLIMDPYEAYLNRTSPNH